MLPATQDRCHRIGQTREVTIYRLVSEATVEENIVKKANQKRLLDMLVIQVGLCGGVCTWMQIPPLPSPHTHSHTHTRTHARLLTTFGCLAFPHSSSLSLTCIHSTSDMNNSLNPSARYHSGEVGQLCRYTVQRCRWVLDHNFLPCHRPPIPPSPRIPSLALLPRVAATPPTSSTRSTPWS